MRDSIGQGRHDDFALLSVEREEKKPQKTDFDFIIDQFESVKSAIMILGSFMIC